MSKRKNGAEERWFDEPFLDEVRVAFERRRKAISYSLRTGGFSIEREEGVEQLVIEGDGYRDSTIRLTIRPDAASLEIRKNTRKVAGKVLLRLHRIRLVHNPQWIVAAFEETVGSLGYVSLERIREIWHRIALSSV